jgi:undecaprenyl-diphosphatase
MRQLFGIEAPLLFDVMLHLGTVLSVLVFFRKEIMKTVDAVMRWDVYAGGRMATYLVLGTIPVAVFGVYFHSTIEATFGQLYDVGMLMLLMGFILYNTRFVKGHRKLNMKDAVVIGVAQTISLLPGISRSGVTIAAGMMRKVDKEQAFVFSFMLAVPVIVGAAGYELYRAGLGVGDYIITSDMWVGFSVAAIVGYMSLDMLRSFVMRQKLYRFAFYCWIVGILVIAASFL